MDLIRNWKSKMAHRRAEKQCGDDEMVCGFLREDGTPEYFIMPKAATNLEVQTMAFSLKHQRPMTRLEMAFQAHAHR